MKLRRAAAADKNNLFPFERVPHPDSSKRWLGSTSDKLLPLKGRMQVRVSLLTAHRTSAVVGTLLRQSAPSTRR
jgi:hypothetical protein